MAVLDLTIQGNKEEKKVVEPLYKRYISGTFIEEDASLDMRKTCNYEMEVNTDVIKCNNSTNFR